MLIENFRPGTLERWGLGPDVLHEINPGLVIVRTTGFGQTGPYATCPASARSPSRSPASRTSTAGPTGRPTLPPFALGDGVAALTGAFAAMMALWWREHGGNGKGQVIDLSIYEPLFWILGPQALVYDQLGDRPGPHRQPRALHGAAQRLPGEGRPLARPLGAARSRSPSA